MALSAISCRGTMFAGGTVYWVAGKGPWSGTLRLVAGVVAGCEGTSMSSGLGPDVGKLKLLCTVMRIMPPPPPNALHTRAF